jgi:two-component system cell cycle sensor histidine kinase/response regulator CckA
VESGEVTINEVPLPNNQYLLVQWSKAVTNDGRLHVIETITDVTEQKRVEEAARKAEKMEALSRLAGGMAHDINNLLTVITGASEQVSYRVSDSGAESMSLRKIQGAVDRAAELTRRLVAFSHHQVVQPTLIDLTMALQEMEQRIRAVLGDDHSLEQIVTVLVSNAREAMPDGGRLIITTALHDVAEVAAKEQGVKPGPYVRLEVRDTGRGIAPDVQPHLFEPFFVRTGEETGRGLGLASVYGMVRQHGGFIEVASKCNVGTVLTVVLPRSEQIQHTPIQVSHASVSEAHRDILLVEDDEDVRMAVSDMLKIAGYHVQEASDGMDALQRLQNMASPPHLVLTDVMMPRMTGLQLAAQIQTIMPKTQVLFMSGYSDQILEPVGGKPLAFVHKPFTARELIRKVRETLAR